MIKILKRNKNLIKTLTINNHNYIKNGNVKDESLNYRQTTDTNINRIKWYLKNGHFKFTLSEEDFIKRSLSNNIESELDTSFLPSYQNEDEIKKFIESHLCEGMSLQHDFCDSYEYQWLNDKFLSRKSLYPVNDDDKMKYLMLMKKGEHFDYFLSKRFQSVKRYSGEGAESMLVFVYELCKTSRFQDISDIVISMAHRGRNNLLTVLLNYPAFIYFRKMKGKSEFPERYNYITGDTFSHFYTSTKLKFNDKELTVSLIPNPSHLEANIPVGAGKVRSRMLRKLEGDYSCQNNKSNISTMALFIHGDASVCGQGIVTESLVMTQSPNFEIGGSVHIVINNRLGFTTETPSGLQHVTDVGKIVNAPVIHVDAFNIEEVARAARIAVDYRNKFHKDIFINYVCFRKWGHNELDDPTITQPIMYNKIHSLKSIPECYYDLLSSENFSHINKVDEDFKQWKILLEDHIKDAEFKEPELFSFKNQWKDMKTVDSNVKSIGIYNTGFNEEKLRLLGNCSVFIPDNFTAHENVRKTHIQRRLDKMKKSDNNTIDWATAEAMAIGSLLSEGYSCRISGQDVGRGTFNHRHFKLIDQTNNTHCIPFNECQWPDIFNKRGRLEVANSILSEEAVLGFEFGMALDDPDRLCIWEAQFGDFFNGAQIIIDTYLGSTETKWLLQNGLVLLLPHGYDGAGPEHSSCRIERFLQLTDSKETEPDSDVINMSIVNPTTPAQYFHVLRRQMMRPFRKPLVVIAPKILLRSPLAVSSFNDIKEDTYFQHIIPHSTHPPSTVTKVLMCSGKHYYSLLQYLNSEIKESSRKDYAIIRLEQLTPFPVVEIQQQLKQYKNAKNFIWCQEEPRNMGAWQFVESRFRNILGLEMKYAGRKELATPAVGIGELYKKEVEDILKIAFSY